MTRFLIFVAVALSLSSCASILERSTQEVTFLTPGTYDSLCLVDNGETVYRVWPPQTVTLSKRAHDLKVQCIAEGNRERTIVIDPQPQGIALANAFNGFAPGLFIDHESGALYAYPDTIVVDFTGMPARPMPLPNYEQYLAENPNRFGMEEFRPGDAALIRDKYEVGVPLKKRELPGSGASFSEFTTITEGADEVPATTAPPTGAGETGDAAGATTSGGAAAADPSSDFISDLTRKMNPQVFGPQEGAPVPLQPGSDDK